MTVPKIYSLRTSTSAYRAHAKERRTRAAVTLLRRVICAMITLLLLVISGTSFSFVGDTDGASPFLYLVPAWVAAVGLFSTPVGGACFGICVGTVTDAASGASLYFLPILFGLFGYASGMIGVRVLSRRFWMWLLCDAGVVVLYTAYRIVAAVIAVRVTNGVFPWLGALLSETSSDAVFAALLAVFLYFPAKWIFFTKKNTPEDALL